MGGGGGARLIGLGSHMDQALVWLLRFFPRGGEQFIFIDAP